MGNKGVVPIEQLRERGGFRKRKVDLRPCRLCRRNRASLGRSVNAAGLVANQLWQHEAVQLLCDLFNYENKLEGWNRSRRNAAQSCFGFFRKLLSTLQPLVADRILQARAIPCQLKSENLQFCKAALNCLQ